MPKIVCLHTLAAEHLDRIREAAPSWEIIYDKDEEARRKHLKDAEIVVGWNSLAAQEALGPESQLRWVQHWSAGVDSMPMQEFRRRGIVLTNASGVHAYPISETVFAMMLSLSRKIHSAIRRQMQKKWGGLGELAEIHGRTLGIVGVGAIGEETARLAKAFGMRVLGVRRSGEPASFVDRMFDNSGLTEVLGDSDFVVVTLPLTDETRHMFGRDQFEAMKSTAYYINIGRGGTTDTDALLKALENGTIAGAGLDVFEQEPLPETSPLWELDNVILTPHNSGSTVYYDERAMGIFLLNLREYLAGREPSINRVDLMKQY